MDKVSGISSQAMPLWERQHSMRGHYSSVDGALKAHRQQINERRHRIEERMSIDHGNNANAFFPGPAATGQQMTANVNNAMTTMNNAPAVTANPVTDMAQGIENQAPEAQFYPMEMDDIYSEASLASVGDNAIGVVQKEIANNPNPQNAPADETPKGSYVDYTV